MTPFFLIVKSRSITLRTNENIQIFRILVIISSVCVSVCMRAYIHILKFTQNGVTMTTGSCVSAPMGEREKEREMSASVRWEPARAELYNGFATLGFHQGHSEFGI